MARYFCLYVVCLCLTCYTAVLGVGVTYSDILASAAFRSNKDIITESKQFLQKHLPDMLYTLNARDAKTWTNVNEFLRQEYGQSTNQDGRLTAVVGNYNVSDTCFNHTLLVLNGLSNGADWALQFVDAFGKIPPGILDGNYYLLGSYDECLRIRYRNTSDTKNVFRGQHCTLQVPITQNNVIYVQLLTLGVCFPSSCSDHDVTAFVNTALAAISTGNGSRPLFVFGAKCNVDGEANDYDARAIGAFVLIGVIGLMMVIGTVYDVWVYRWGPWSRATLEEYSLHPDRAGNTEKTSLLGNNERTYDYVGEPGTPGKLLLAFSVYTNGEKLLSTKQAAGSLTAVNGIRVLSMFWVILGHSYVFTQNVAGNYPQFLSEQIERETFQVVLNGLLSVDTFFALSGVLVAYLTLREMKKNNGRLNWAMFFFHRFWRLTPAYMMVLFVYVCLFRYWGDGPFWRPDGFEQNYCEDSWWKNLLYINNFFSISDMCMAWSWYLSNDMQFFLLSPLMLIPLYLSQTIGLAVCVIFLLGTLTATGVITTTGDMPVTMFSPTVPLDKILPYMDDYYVKPYCRMGPYIVGIVTGYLLYRTEGKFRINRMINVACWMMFAVLACLCVYGMYEENKGTADLSTNVLSLYNTLHRSVWGACVCWVIFSCANGYGGFVNDLLSWKALLPLSRLTYCAYLIHPIIIYCISFNRRVPLYMDDITMVTLFLGALVAAYTIAFVVSLAFESPMMGLEKVLFQRKQK